MEYKGYLTASGIKSKYSCVESHKALGAGERYQECLRQIFKKIQEESPTLSKEEAFFIPVHAMNSIAGPNGLSPIQNNIPANDNVVGGRFTCTIKNFGSQKEISKARYMAHGHILPFIERKL